jgi:hypothetical protein
MNAADSKKHFTVSEANAMLPLVRAIVDDIVRLYNEVHDRRERLSKIRQISGGRDEEHVYSEEVEQSERDLEKDIDRLNGFVEELQGLGVILKDPVVGLVDFPGRIDGRDVCLCWKLGEGDIGYWHELDAGFEGRQSLLADSVQARKPTRRKKEGPTPDRLVSSFNNCGWRRVWLSNGVKQRRPEHLLYGLRVKTHTTGRKRIIW